MLYESSEPISLGRYKQMWEYIIGAKYKTHYELHKNGKRIENDETIMLENQLNEYEVYLNRELQVVDNQQIQQKEELKNTNILNKIVKVATNEIMF